MTNKEATQSTSEQSSEAENHSSISINQNQRRLPLSEIKAIGEFDGITDVYSNQYLSHGYLLEMWADVIEGRGDQAERFRYLYLKRLQKKIESKTETTEDVLVSTGLKTPSRKMLFHKLSPVSVAVYIARQGSDLYVSWRAFSQGVISYHKVLIFIVIGVILSSPFSGIISYSSRGGFVIDPYNINWEVFFFTLMIIGSVMAVWIIWQGIFNHNGDIFALLREPVFEIHVDDAIALTTAVHQSLIGAADELGVDTAKLLVRESMARKRRKPRF